MKRLTKKEFIEKAKLIHSNKYDYSLVDYKNNSTKVSIICSKHGAFDQVPNSHLLGVNCPKCHNLNKTKCDFVNDANKIHNNFFDYGLVKYKNSKIKIKIICPNHGVFEQTPNSHLNGNGCPNCNGKIKLDNWSFIKKANNIHNYEYDYSLVDYKNSKTKIKIICPSHDIFEQQPDSHLQGVGCPNCSTSKGEETISTFLIKNKIIFIHQHKFIGCKHKRLLPFDFYLPNNNICIEFDGKQHRKSIKFFGGDKTLKDLQIRDSIKTIFCEKNNILLVRITEKKQINNTLINLLINK